MPDEKQPAQQPAQPADATPAGRAMLPVKVIPHATPNSRLALPAEGLASRWPSPRAGSAIRAPEGYLHPHDEQ